VATAGCRSFAGLGASEYAVRKLRARTTHESVSQRVLTKAGFIPGGDAEVGVRPGIWYERILRQSQ